MSEYHPYYFYSENEPFVQSEEELKFLKDKSKSLVRKLFSLKSKK